MAETTPGFVPGEYTIDAYGSGGFKFAGMSHRGSVLVLPTGVHAWMADEPSAITAFSLQSLFDLRKARWNCCSWARAKISCR